MTIQFKFDIIAFAALPEARRLSDLATQAAQIAVNDVARSSRTLLAEEIRKQVNFPKAYLNPNTDRLAVTKFATRSDLTAIVTGRARPTSLARFATNPNAKRGVTVQVKPGSARFMKRAFFIKLRSGNADIETRNNQGLAIRLRPGETVRNKSVTFKKTRAGFYLLYGPSVDQVLAGSRGAIVKRENQIARELETEFLRQLDRLERRS